MSCHHDTASKKRAPLFLLCATCTPIGTYTTHECSRRTVWSEGWARAENWTWVRLYWSNSILTNGSEINRTGQWPSTSHAFWNDPDGRSVGSMKKRLTVCVRTFATKLPPERSFSDVERWTAGNSGHTFHALTQNDPATSLWHIPLNLASDWDSNDELELDILDSLRKLGSTLQQYPAQINITKLCTIPSSIGLSSTEKWTRIQFFF